MMWLKHEGYKAKVEFSIEENVFFGKLYGIRDLVSFGGRCLSELTKSFRCSIDDYFDTCKEVGKHPEDNL